MPKGFVKRNLQDFVKISVILHVYERIVLRIGKLDTKRIIYVTMKYVTNQDAPIYNAEVFRLITR